MDGRAWLDWQFGRVGQHPKSEHYLWHVRKLSNAKRSSVVCLPQNEFFVFGMNGNVWIDLYACLAQVKLALEIEYNICKNSNKEKDFQKFKFVYYNI